MHRILPLGADAVANAERETAKYLSKAIKEATGRSASDWIDEYVATESKALLYSTTKTIQQIASELHFDSQSLFGKYFKRVTGISPREYRTSIAQGNSN
ncbi:MAG: helix-turn-helix transcriptional regulator [Tidjanibacter sp.]|nr:helix-turn-helix transcriptional regulator [Tidjanibacter sp.]